MNLPIRSLQLRRISALPALALLMAASPLAAQVSINEIRIDQPSTDNDEYFELAGPAATDLSALTYLVIGDGSDGSGVIEAVVSLDGSSIPGSGFFVAAENSFTLGTADLTTSLNFENSDNVTHLLVSGFTGSNGDDLDSNDDGVLDAAPWSELVDCIALVETVGSGDLVYCADTVGPDGFFVPGHAVYCPGGFEIGAFSPVGANDTPGSVNDCGQVSVEISEIRIDQSGTDNDEYFELAGDTGDALDGLTYLVIGDGAGGSGSIEAVVDLSGSSIPASGFFVAAEDTFSLGTADLTTLLNFENSDNVTHLVVRNFTGSNGDDLDSNDDGVLDTTPWSELVDCIALVETVGSGDLVYCADTVGPNGAFVPAHAFLCPDGFQIGAFSPLGDSDTPGAANSCAGGPTGGTLVINEIDYDQPGTDTAEFIEIYNADSGDVSLSGFSLELVNGNGGSVYRTIALPDVTLAAGDYFVVCANSATVIGCDLDVSPDTNLVQNGAPDAVALTFGGTIIDTVSYEGDLPGYTELSGAGLSDDSFGGTGGLNENKSISRLPDGYDTNQNNVDFQFVCSTPGAANSATSADCPSIAPPVLLINEIDYDQPGSDAAEFIEIVNNGLDAADLGSVTIQLINGNGGSVYRTIALPNVSLAAGDYFVICGNAASVANCDLDVSPDTNLVQNGAPDAVVLSSGGIILDTVSYEGNTSAPYTEGSGSGLQDSGATGQDFRGIGRFPDGTDTNVNNVDFVNACITPGGPNTSLTTDCTALAPALEIWEIQGAGAASVFDGQTIQTRDNVVTAVGTDRFAMQTPATRSDGDGNTSDGIIVFTGSAPAVAQGDVVTVTGEVIEFFGLTEFSGVTSIDIVSSGYPMPTPVMFDATVPSPDPTAPSCSIEFECYEGMLVNIVDGTVTGPNQRFNTDPIAEVHITAASARTFREPGVEFPGLGAPIPTWDGNPEVFELDPDKLGLPNLIIPAGSSFHATGVLGFEFGGYELWPSMLDVTPALLPVPVRAREAGEMTVGTLNLFRLFDDIDNEPDGIRNDVVVDTLEYQRRLDKFSSYIVDVLRAPDILAVQEVESIDVLAALAERIETQYPSVVYSALLLEGNDIGTIDVGFLVRSNIMVNGITRVDPDATFFNPVTMEYDILHDRPPLLLEGSSELDFGTFPIAVMVVHNRSLSRIDDPVQGERVRKKRLLQAESIAAWVQEMQSNDPDVRLVVTGDFNAFEFTDGYVDAIGVITGNFDSDASLVCSEGPGCSGILVDPSLDNQVLQLSPEERYSFIFRGTAQVLDHTLTTQKLADEVTGVEYGRGNADAAVDLINEDGLINLPLRSSDHDGLVVYISRLSWHGDSRKRADE
jgi:predicted extracellular nuclease